MYYTTKTAEEKDFSPIPSTTFGPKAECEKAAPTSFAPAECHTI
jgi:hypothetical protein